MKDIITPMDLVMPDAFPSTQFRGFLNAASDFFPKLLSDEDLYDPRQRKRHFDWSWQAVRYRYRSCAEANEEFRSLLENSGDMWTAGCDDGELTYKLERCIYIFFMSGLSIFDSFAFCLYYLGNIIQPSAFPDVANRRSRRNITRATTAKALGSAFPDATVTAALKGLSDDPRFKTLDAIRNLVGHRLSGRRTVSAGSEMNEDGTFTELWHEEKWHTPGAVDELTFDEHLLERQLDNITQLLAPLVTAAREFAEQQRLARVCQ